MILSPIAPILLKISPLCDILNSDIKDPSQKEVAIQRKKLRSKTNRENLDFCQDGVVMARQGKMHSSPFHIESQQYMYAVEHEVEPQHNTKVIPDCEYVDSTKNMCRKWNSGTQKCESYKCMFMNKELRRQATCKVCAYHYKGLC